MTLSKVDVYKCDRCDSVTEVRKGHEHYEWGKATYFQYNGPLYNRNIISKSHIPEPDICPKCIKELDEWWKRGKT